MDFPWLFLKFNIQFIRNQFFAGANLLREHFDVMNINWSLSLSLSLSLLASWTRNKKNDIV